MIVTHKIKIVMDAPGIAPIIQAVQGDTCTRAVEARLYTGKSPMKLPPDTHVLLRFQKPDGTGGCYDSLPDGARAWSINSNVVTVVLAPQVLSAVGDVTAQIELIHGSDVLSTFGFHINVERNASANVREFGSYVNLSGWVKENLDQAMVAALEIPTSVSQLTNDAGYLTARDLDVNLKPEFAASVDQCMDTTKLYVLPDGYLYAYMKHTVSSNYTNQLPIAVGTDGLVYNGGMGYKVGCRLNSSGVETATNGVSLTGFIPCRPGDVIRLKNMNFQSGDTSSAHRLGVYNSAKASILVRNSGDVGINYADGFGAVLDDAGAIVQFIIPPEHTDAAYFRISAANIGETSVITVNQEIKEGTTTAYGWVSTGHAFVPADYEDRIMELERQNTVLSGRVLNLEGTSGDGQAVPTYIRAEARRVAEAVQAKRTPGSLTFAAMSDPHIYAGTSVSWLMPNLTSVRDAGLGMEELRKHIPLDFAAMLGDYTYGAGDCTVAQLKSDIRYFKECIAGGVAGIPNLWLTGNHDINYGANSDRRMTEDELFACVTGNNVGTVQDSANIGRNYGYIDFENQKIRCIYLNGVDALDYPDNTGSADDALEITATQTRWLANVGLNLSKKADPTGWQIVIFSHQAVSLFPHVLTVLEGYRNGSAGTVTVTTNGVSTQVSFNFTAGGRGEVIANIHGHNHNFSVKRIGSGERWLWRICVPNMDTTRENEAATSADADWAKEYGEFNASGTPVYHKKTQETAKSTSFCVFTIDRKNRKIHALHYGAGIDREISY